MNTHENAPFQTINIEGLRLKFSLGRTAMYQLTRDPSFPAAYAISARHYLWELREVDAWLASRKGKTRSKVRKLAPISPRDEVLEGIRFVKRVA